MRQARRLIVRDRGWAVAALLAWPALCAAAMPAAPLSAPVSSWQAGVDAVGPIRLGMTLAEASRATGLALSEEPPRGNGDWEACHYAWLIEGERLRLDLGLMLEHGVVTRIDVATPDVATRSGARVGDAESSVLDLYAGRVEAAPAAANEPRYLVAYPQQLRQLVFIAEDGRVVAYRIGRQAAAQNSEGCA